MKSFAPFIISFILLLATLPLSALEVGSIKILKAEGEVTLVDNATSQGKAAGVGQTFTQGSTVKTGANSTAELVFSTGTHVHLTPNTSLNIQQHQQASYNEALGSFEGLRRSPSQSQTYVELNYGEVLTSVKRLAPSSHFEVNTPTVSLDTKQGVFAAGFSKNEQGQYVTRVVKVSGDTVAVAHMPAKVSVTAEGIAQVVTDKANAISTGKLPMRTTALFIATEANLTRKVDAGVSVQPAPVSYAASLVPYKSLLATSAYKGRPSFGRLTKVDIDKSPDAQGMVPGDMRVFMSVGKVEFKTSDGAWQRLRRGQTLYEGTSLRVGARSRALLYFSNGASIDVEENTEFIIPEFRQLPFDKSMGNYVMLDTDPSASSTKLKINEGKMVAFVKELQPTSLYTMDTPNGVAKITGTIIGYDSAFGGFSMFEGSSLIVTPSGNVLGMLELGQTSRSTGGNSINKGTLEDKQIDEFEGKYENQVENFGLTKEEFDEIIFNLRNRPTYEEDSEQRDSENVDPLPTNEETVFETEEEILIDPSEVL